MKTPILGSSYVLRSPNAAANRMVNLYPEAISEGGKESAFLTRCPGLRLLATVGTGPIRGMWKFRGLGYIVSGSRLYSINSSWVSVDLGSVSGDREPVCMADNGRQLFIACNGPSYIYDIETGLLEQIVDPDFRGAVNVGYLDGYFVFNEPNSQKVWVTDLLNGKSVDALDFASAEGAPDKLVGLMVDHREVWLFGENSVEVWYNSGGADFPLTRLQGAYNELGCAAPYSIVKMDNGLFWLGSDDRGNGMVYRANGYTGQRISTHAIESEIQTYGDISDAVGFSYQQDGHLMYVLNFPTANKTWAYDAATNLWHERAGWDSTQGKFTRHRGNCHMSFNTRAIIGDYQNGKIYEFDMTTYADDSEIQKWLRSWRALPSGQNNLKRTIHHTLQLDCESGVGLNLGQGSDPEVSLRWSDDGGHTWSNAHVKKMGKFGDYGYRVIWRRLGSTHKLRDRIYEVSGTDPVKVIINGAELSVEGTNA